MFRGMEERRSGEGRHGMPGSARLGWRAWAKCLGRWASARPCPQARTQNFYVPHALCSVESCAVIGSTETGTTLEGRLASYGRHTTNVTERSVKQVGML